MQARHGDLFPFLDGLACCRCATCSRERNSAIFSSFDEVLDLHLLLACLTRDPEGEDYHPNGLCRSNHALHAEPYYSCMPQREE